MPNSNSTMIRKLQSAINSKGEKLLYSTFQFYSEQQKRPVTMYVINKLAYCNQLKRDKRIELFKSTSQIQIVLFLRDYWYKLNKIELPMDNEQWNKIRENIKNEKA